MILKTLTDKNIAHPPKWLNDNIIYATLMGSICYNVSTDTSDIDIYGVCIPKKEDIFPHLKGEIKNFGTQKKDFLHYVEHGLKYENKTYDFTIYSIVRYFHLLLENNPNILDSLFTDRKFVIKTSNIGELIREKKKIFLSKKLYHTFRGYSFAQLNKINKPKENSHRKEGVEKYGYDLKHSTHIFRLCLEAEQLLSTGDMDLTRDSEQLKKVRQGLYTEEEIREWFKNKEKYLSELYQTSNLPYSPPEEEIKQLLLECLEIHYGSIDECVKNLSKYETAIRQIQDIVGKL